MPEVMVWYPLLKSVHIALVGASGSLFALRGALVLTGQGWAMARPWRLLSYGIDTLLLAAGVSLWIGLSLNPVASPWFGAKLCLLVLYILLGSLALKRARSRKVRLASYVGALVVYGFIASVALTHQPQGLLHPWLGHGA